MSYGVYLVTTLEKIYHILMRLNHIKYRRELIPKLLSSLILWLISISLHPTQQYSRKPITIHRFMWIYNNFIGKDIFLYWPDNILSSYLLQLFLTSRGWFNMMMPSYQYRKYLCGEEIILWPSFLHSGFFLFFILVRRLYMPNTLFSCHSNLNLNE